MEKENRISKIYEILCNEISYNWIMMEITGRYQAAQKIEELINPTTIERKYKLVEDNGDFNCVKCYFFLNGCRKKALELGLPDCVDNQCYYIEDIDTSPDLCCGIYPSNPRGLIHPKFL